MDRRLLWFIACLVVLPFGVLLMPEPASTVTAQAQVVERWVLEEFSKVGEGARVYTVRDTATDKCYAAIKLLGLGEAGAASLGEVPCQ